MNGRNHKSQIAEVMKRNANTEQHEERPSWRNQSALSCSYRLRKYRLENNTDPREMRATGARKFTVFVILHSNRMVVIITSVHVRQTDIDSFQTANGPDAVVFPTHAHCRYDGRTRLSCNWQLATVNMTICVICMRWKSRLTAQERLWTACEYDLRYSLVESCIVNWLSPKS